MDEAIHVFGTPVYFEFLAGKRDLTCSAWAIPTRNIRGWKGPCYLMTDAHYSSYAELLEKTQWDRYGVVNGVARDSRCENCMVHCGYEPTATSGACKRSAATPGRRFRFNFGPKPKPTGRGSETLAFNGVSSGNGHLTGKRASERRCCASLVEIDMRESSNGPDRHCRAHCPTSRSLYSADGRPRLRGAIARAQENLLRQQQPGRPLVRRADRR